MNESQPNESGPRPMAGPINDLRKIRDNGGATAKELRDFLAQMQGKNPREVLSAVSASGLFRGVVAASIWTAITVAVFTAGPYVMGQIKGDNKEQAQAEGGDDGKKEGGENAGKTADAKSGTEPAKAGDPNAASKAGDPAAAMADGAPAAPGTPPTGAAATKAVDTLGIGETKIAPANKNPLENAADDLLKGLK